MNVKATWLRIYAPKPRIAAQILEQAERERSELGTETATPLRCKLDTYLAHPARLTREWALSARAVGRLLKMIHSLSWYHHPVAYSLRFQLQLPDRTWSTTYVTNGSYTMDRSELAAFFYDVAGDIELMRGDEPEEMKWNREATNAPAPGI